MYLATRMNKTQESTWDNGNHVLLIVYVCQPSSTIKACYIFVHIVCELLISYAGHAVAHEPCRYAGDMQR